MAAGLKAAIIAMSLFCLSESVRLRQKRGPDDELPEDDSVNISYAEFAATYRRDLEHGSPEYRKRKAIFEESVRQVQEHNSKPDVHWVLEINWFSDWTEDEKRGDFGLVRRYRMESDHGRESSPGGGRSIINFSNYTGGDTGGLTIDDGPPVLSQGACGSSYAMSAVGVIEARLIFSSSKHERLAAHFSPQALVDCAPNPKECGGTGGCNGATLDVAYTYVAAHGLPTDEAWPYQAREQKCPYNPSRINSSKWVKIGGHSTIYNQYNAVMNMLVERGPASVLVAASELMPYHTGTLSCNSRDVVLNHAVMLKGFGVDKGIKYWLVQNSWGDWWGEKGHIRIRKRDDEETFCGWDYKPKKGYACKGDSETRLPVCGSCGILAAVSQPFEITLLKDGQPKRHVI